MKIKNKIKIKVQDIKPITKGKEKISHLSCKENKKVLVPFSHTK